MVSREKNFNYMSSKFLCEIGPWSIRASVAGTNWLFESKWKTFIT